MVALSVVSAALVFLQTPALRPPADTLPAEILEAYELIASAHVQDAIRTADQFRGGTDSSATDLVVVSTVGELATTLIGAGTTESTVTRSRDG
ncbi:MAG: hypothetical protein Q8Q14_10525, partial [Gemmatimonadales bacterium]|nr:hypothetical protein [Gemmatimonadales bacterium]